MIDWEAIALYTLIGVVFGICIWQYVEWRIGAHIGWFIDSARVALEAAVDIAQVAETAQNELDERIVEMIEKVVAARIDAAIDHMSQRALAADPLTIHSSEDIPY